MIEAMKKLVRKEDGYISSTELIVVVVFLIIALAPIYDTFINGLRLAYGRVAAQLFQVAGG